MPATTSTADATADKRAPKRTATRTRAKKRAVVPAGDPQAGWPAASVTSRLLTLGPIAFAGAAVLALIAALAVGGGAAPLAVADPGPIVMVGVPVMRLLWNIAASATIGGLVFGTWVLSRDESEFELAMRFASGSAVAWVIATLGAILFTFLQISNVPFSADAAFGQQLWFFLSTIAAGQNWLMALVMVAILSTLVFAVRRPWPVGLTTVWALFCLWPLASQGHAAGAAGHETAVGSLTLHYTGAAVWLGGLLVIAVLAAAMPGVRRLAMIDRYSSLALLSFIVVAFSGVVSSILNLGTVDALFGTGYGMLIMAKAVGLILLGVLGALQRRRLIARMRTRLDEQASTTRPMVELIVIELAVMGAVAGIAAALGRTPTPVPQLTADQLQDPTPAQILTGEVHPPEFEFMRLFTEWRFDPIWTLLALLGIFFYFAGVRRLAKRGDRWPIFRSVSFVMAMLVLIWLVNGALIVYGKFMFSHHMVQHMILTMLIPIFLALSGPITLLLRAVKPRKDGSEGSREWALKAVHSKWGRFISHPVVAAVLFALSLLTFYYTPLFRWAVTDHVGHMWMIADFLTVGYLFSSSLIGVDPVKRAPYAMRLISLVLVMTFHAFFGLSIMTGEGLLVADWFGNMGRTWGPSALQDQQLGGAAAWGIGEFPTVILAVIVSIEWFRRDERVARHRDQRVEAHGDAELEAYNAHLRKLAELDAQREAQRGGRS